MLKLWSAVGAAIVSSVLMASAQTHRIDGSKVTSEVHRSAIKVLIKEKDGVVRAGSGTLVARAVALSAAHNFCNADLGTWKANGSSEQPTRKQFLENTGVLLYDCLPQLIRVEDVIVPGGCASLGTPNHRFKNDIAVLKLSKNPWDECQKHRPNTVEFVSKSNQYLQKEMNEGHELTIHSPVSEPDDPALQKALQHVFEGKHTHGMPGFRSNGYVLNGFEPIERSKRYMRGPMVDEIFLYSAPSIRGTSGAAIRYVGTSESGKNYDVAFGVVVGSIGAIDPQTKSEKQVYVGRYITEDVYDIIRELEKQ